MLLSTPLNAAFNSLDSFQCSHTSIVGWHTFLVRKSPFLAFDRIPLFCNPPVERETIVVTDTSPAMKFEWTSGIHLTKALV
jgi:hypothetical protein